MTGRCVRSGIEYARMRQDQRQFLSITYQGEMYTGPTGPNGLPSPIALHKARQLNYYSKMYTATLCAVPEFDKKNRLFELSRIKSVSDLLHNVDVARELKLEFEKSMERGSYKEAIRCFEQYRELPDRADSETCMRMELRLSKKCPRLRLNSYSTPADVNIGFDMSPLESDWMDARDDRCKEAAKIAEAIAEKKSPISCVDENGKEIKIQGYCTALLVKSDLSSAYVIIEKDKKDIDILSEEGNAVFEIDLNKKIIKQVYYGGKRRIAVAPNGTTLAIHGVNWYNLQKLHASIPMVIRDGVSSEYKIAGGECGRVSFSPNSDFLLCSSEHALLLKKEAYENLKHYIIGLIPISEKEPYTVEKTVLPMCEGQPVFSADGLHLLAADNEKTVPWLRLSWDYSVPGKGSKRTEVVDSNKEKERLEEEAKRKIEKEEKMKEKKGKKEERAAHTKQLRDCFLTIAFYILLISILTGFILNLIWAGNISSVIKDGNSVIGTAIRDSDFFLSPSVTLEYTVDGEQYEVKNTMRFDKIDTDGAEDDSDRRKVEIFYESDHPEKAYTRDTLALAELRRTIFLIAFIVLEAIRLVAFIRYRRKNRKYYSKHPIV